MTISIKVLAATVILFALSAQAQSGPSSESANAPVPADAEPKPAPKKLSDFKPGESTAGEVQAALGKPAHEDHNPDGRFVYLYHINPQVMAAFLFDKEGRLIRVRAYQDSNAK